ncbi:MAG: phosphatase PAP2 family protein [Bacteroidota bacterium]
MYWITYKLTWFPFYALIIFLLARKYRWRAIGMVVAIVLVIVLADQTASTLFKPYFQRLRPCHEPALQAWIHIVGGCGGQYGFVSSHSANAFGLAMALWLMFRKALPSVVYLFIWALVVSYSRIYVGAHYPLDLLVGALIGCIYALIVVWLYDLLAKKYFSINRFTHV